MHGEDSDAGADEVADDVLAIARLSVINRVPPWYDLRASC